MPLLTIRQLLLFLSAACCAGLVHAQVDPATTDEQEKRQAIRAALAATPRSAESFEQTIEAANQGDAIAQFNLGVRYINGNGVDKDPAAAVKWFRTAADQGLANAQFNLGVCYAEGLAVDQDAKEAVAWYEKAARQGHAMAQCNLGVCFKAGNGVDRDEQEAVVWSA